MDREEIESFKKAQRNMSTDELLTAWEEHDDEEWSKGALISIKELLNERGVLNEEGKRVTKSSIASNSGIREFTVNWLRGSHHLPKVSEYVVEAVNEHDAFANAVEKFKHLDYPKVYITWSEGDITYENPHYMPKEGNPQYTPAYVTKTAGNHKSPEKYKYVEFDQTFWGGADTQTKVMDIIEKNIASGMKLHSFNVITLQGLILFQKQRYCLMFEKR